MEVENQNFMIAMASNVFPPAYSLRQCMREVQMHLHEHCFHLAVLYIQHDSQEGPSFRSLAVIKAHSFCGHAL